MKMIWITIESILPANSGGRIGIFRRLEQLSKYNEIYLYYTMDSENDSQYIKELKKYCIEVHGYVREKKSIKTIVNSIKAPYTVASRKNEYMIEDIKKCMKENSIDLINVDSPHMGLNLMELKTNIPIVLNQHNIEWKVYLNIAKSNNNLIKKFVYFIDAYRFKWFEEKLYKKVNFKMITFVSSEDMNFFKETHKLNCKLELVPVGAIEYDNDYNWDKKDSYKILFVGKMNYAPNSEAVLNFAKNIYPTIKKEIDKAEFWVVGKDPTTEILSLKSDSIHVTGSVPSVDSYYQDADLVVVPLLHGGGVKVKLLEAMGHNVPIVSSMVGVQGTEFNENNLLIASNDDDFAQKCISFFKSKKTYREMYSNLFHIFSNKYTWKEIGKKYNVLLNGLTKTQE